MRFDEFSDVVSYLKTKMTTKRSAKYHAMFPTKKKKLKKHKKEVDETIASCKVC